MLIDFLPRLFCAVSVALGMLLLSRKCLHYFQLESYQFQGYFHTLIRQWKYALLPGVIAAAGCFLIWRAENMLGGMIYSSHSLHAPTAGDVIKTALVSLAAAALTLLDFWAIARYLGRQKEKKPFVVTARVKRLYLVLMVVLALIQALIWLFGGTGVWESMRLQVLWNALAVALLPLLVALAGLLAMPIEKLIFSLYFHDAERKIMENEKLIRIGITGSYGKTSTKFILATILSQKFNVLATPASFNTPMGVTRIIRERLSPSHQVFIGEMGARHVGEIRELSRLVHPQIGVLTSVGPQHLDTFRTMERIEKTKYELIDALPDDGFAVFLHDDAIVTRLHDRTGKNKALVGKESADAWAEDVHVSPDGSHFRLCLKGWEPIACETRLLGEHNIKNILTACAVAKHLGMNREQIARGVMALKPVEHRLQLLPNASGITVIDDAFNSNPRSCKAALQVLSMFPGRRVIVTPGLVELGAEEERYNYEFGQAMAGAVDLAVLVGKKHTLPIQKGLKDAGFPAENIHVMSSLDEAVIFNRKNLRPGDVVMYENDLPDHYSEG